MLSPQHSIQSIQILVYHQSNWGGNVLYMFKLGNIWPIENLYAKRPDCQTPVIQKQFCSTLKILGHHKFTYQ